MFISQQNQLHAAIKSIENDLSERLARASPHDSWRTSARLFGQDSSYIKSGLFNMSAGWYPPGRTVSSYLRPTLKAANALSSSSVILRSPRHYSGRIEAWICSAARAMRGRYSPASFLSFTQRNTKWEFKSMQVWRLADDRPTSSLTGRQRRRLSP